MHSYVPIDESSTIIDQPMIHDTNICISAEAFFERLRSMTSFTSKKV